MIYMESSLIIELKESRKEIDELIKRLERMDAFEKEFMNELESMNFSKEQKDKLARMILGQ